MSAAVTLVTKKSTGGGKSPSRRPRPISYLPPAGYGWTVMPGAHIRQRDAVPLGQTLARIVGAHPDKELGFPTTSKAVSAVVAEARRVHSHIQQGLPVGDERVLDRYFTWDPKRALDKVQTDEARYLLRGIGVTQLVIKAGQSRTYIREFHVQTATRKPQPGQPPQHEAVIVRLDDIKQDPALQQKQVRSLVAELRQVMRRYDAYKDCGIVGPALATLQQALDSVEQSVLAVKV